MDSRKRVEAPVVQRMVGGVWVDIAKFRSWVYGQNDTMLLCENYAQYEAALKSGKWFSEKADIPKFPPLKGKKQDDADSN